LDVRCDLSVRLRHDLERGDLDAALIKREAGEKGGIAVWPEHLRWVTGTRYPLDRRFRIPRLPWSPRPARARPPAILPICCSSSTRLRGQACSRGA
jgi:DNA-binding transcriptional LysR family regulator